MYMILSTCRGGGYMYCRTQPIHPKANSKGLYPLHRVMMENKIKRSLLSNEDVHHKDEDKNNNKIENLEVLTKSEHAKIHNKKLDLIEVKCDNCNKIFELQPHVYRLKIKRNKSKRIFCSRSCSSTFQNRNKI